MFRVLITGLLTLLIISIHGLIGVTPIISKVVIPVISNYKVPWASKYPTSPPSQPRKLLSR